MNDPQFDAALFGPVFLDHILTGFKDWPRPGHEAFAKSYQREAGGGCFNTACGLAKLGCSAVPFAVVGEDESEWLVDRVRSFGVRTEGIRTSERPTGMTVSVSMPDDRSFFTYEGANADLPEWLEEPSLVERLARARHVHFALALRPDPGIRIIHALQDSGRTVSLDVGWAPEWFLQRGSFELLRLVDIFFPNEAEAEAITGQSSPEAMLSSFEAIGCKIVALKLGADGAALLAGGEYLDAEPIAATGLDTTGAGDAFNAGFLQGFLQHRPLSSCLQRAVVCGSLSVRKPGSLTSFPSLEEVTEYHAKCFER